MSDRDLRALERSNDPRDAVNLLRQQARARQLVWSPPIPGICEGHVGAWHPMNVRACAACSGTGSIYTYSETRKAGPMLTSAQKCTCDEGQLPADPWALVRIRAYAGDGVARELTPAVPHKTCGPVVLMENVDGLPLDPWIDGILSLSRDLPILRGWLAEDCVACSNAPGEIFIHTGKCHPGKKTEFLNTDVWVAMKIACVLTDAVMKSEVKSRIENPAVYATYDMSRIKGFFDAAVAWVECPCPTNAYQLERHRIEVGNDYGWVGDGLDRPGYWLRLWIQAAVRVLDEKPVRDLVRLALRSVL